MIFSYVARIAGIKWDWTEALQGSLRREHLKTVICSAKEFQRWVVFFSVTLTAIHCVKSIQIRSFFWSVFSRIRTEYGEIRSIIPYTVRVRENTDQKKLRIWTLFTQWVFHLTLFIWRASQIMCIHRLMLVDFYLIISYTKLFC